jgi:hypothetical protein
VTPGDWVRAGLKTTDPAYRGLNGRLGRVVGPAYERTVVVRVFVFAGDTIARSWEALLAHEELVPYAPTPSELAAVMLHELSR